jgi:flagellar basal body-associated protein FliL
MKKEIITLCILTLVWISYSGYAQTGQDRGANNQVAETGTKTDQMAIHTANLQDTNRAHTISSADLNTTTEMQQESDVEQVNQGNKEDHKGPAKVGLMIITLMMAVVVFLFSAGD